MIHLERLIIHKSTFRKKKNAITFFSLLVTQQNSLKMEIINRHDFHLIRSRISSSALKVKKIVSYLIINISNSMFKWTWFYRDFIWNACYIQTACNVSMKQCDSKNYHIECVYLSVLMIHLKFIDDVFSV